MSAMHDDQLVTLARLYRIEFTEHEVEVLTTSSSMLTNPEQQEAYVLRMDLTPCDCPDCTAKICVRSAAPDFKLGESRPDDSYVCPFCKAPIVWHLSFTGEQWFTRKRRERQDD